jgi:phosphonate transport system substrate-binding protein
MPEHRSRLRFAIPSSLGPDATARARQLQEYLRGTVEPACDVVVASAYEQMARDLLSGKVDAAWAPPFVCARIEAMGVRVLVRGIRNGASTYRSAVVCRNDSTLTLDALQGAKAAWSDRDSVAGYLLPIAHLRGLGLTPSRCFARQDFVGSFRKALEVVHAAQADLTGIFAPAARSGSPDLTGLQELWPEMATAFRVLAFSDEAPNDGVAVSMSLSPSVASFFEKVLLSMHQSDPGIQTLKECFHAERFEIAPRMGYRALYRIALASV